MIAYRKTLGCLGSAVAFALSAYAAVGFFYYAWRNAAAPAEWPTRKATIWAYSSLALSVIFLAACVVCLLYATRTGSRKT